MDNKTYLIDYFLHNADRIKFKEGTIRVRYKPNEAEAITGAKEHLKSIHPNARYIILYNTREEVPAPQPARPIPSINITINISLGSQA